MALNEAQKARLMEGRMEEVQHHLDMAKMLREQGRPGEAEYREERAEKLRKIWNLPTRIC